MKLTLKHPEYPHLLREIHDPPALIHVKGEVPTAPAIAVVGSRECSRYGRQVAYRLATEMATAGLSVISGLARGIDAAAHRGALDGGGTTVAVLPCGIDRVYPPRNRALAGRIAAGGALLTEFEPGTKIHRGTFQQRNRLIAGLAVLTVVVEAAVRSGALITARYAEEYHRDVLAVPGPINSRTSAGTNQWLATEGAHVCRGINDVLEHLEPGIAEPARDRLRARKNDADVAIEDLDAAGRAVLAAMPRQGPCGVEHLAVATSLGIAQLLAVLTDIEVRGLIRSVGSQQYERLG